MPKRHSDQLREMKSVQFKPPHIATDFARFVKESLLPAYGSTDARE
ncbi:MAG TPA: hypothetical protein VGG64_17235 [Pirellulales bacterium]|jgi:hypothetical protein